MGMFSDDDDDDDMGRRGGRNRDEKPFDPSNREESGTFDDPMDSRLSRRQGQASRFGALGGLGGLSIWTDALGDLDDDDDDDDGHGLGRLLQQQQRSPRSGGVEATDEEVAASRGSNGKGSKGKGKEKAEWGGAWSYSGVTADLRSGGALAEGVEVVGGDACFEEQEDGGQALLMPEGAYLKLALPHVSPWSLEDDGRLHRYSMLVAMRLDALPAASMGLYNGSGPAAAGEQLEHVTLYRNGGVGALGHMGAAEAAVRAERWAWVCVTRKAGELKTYVNGRLCAEVKLEAAKGAERKGAETENQRLARVKAMESRLAGARAADDDKGKGKEGAPPAERFCVDPQHLALFAPREPADGADEAAERGLALRYVRLTSACWSEEKVKRRAEPPRITTARNHHA